MTLCPVSLRHSGRHQTGASDHGLPPVWVRVTKVGPVKRTLGLRTVLRRRGPTRFAPPLLRSVLQIPLGEPFVPQTSLEGTRTSVVLPPTTSRTRGGPRHLHGVTRPLCLVEGGTSQ